LRTPEHEEDIAVNDQTAAPASAENVGDLPMLIPPTDIFETKNAIIMLLDTPGAEPESLNVTLEKRQLTVSARAKVPPPEKYALIHAEFGDGNYERSFMLSDEVDDEHIDAVFKDGVLRLTLPKSTPAAKKITVKSA
jgi:HSP20 family protein